MEYSDELLKELLPMIEMLARKLNPDHEEDLIQVGKEAFLKCLKTYDKGKKTKFSTYVYNKAKRAMQDEMRRAGWFKRLTSNYKMVLFSEFFGEAEAQENLEDIIINREKSSIMKDAMKKLNKDQARVIKLIYWNGMNRLECASSMGISESRCSQLISEAHKIIKESMK
jgi:RNA polymerase sigma factor (sigma-70 family)